MQLSEEKILERRIKEHIARQLSSIKYGSRELIIKQIEQIITDALDGFLANRLIEMGKLILCKFDSIDRNSLQCQISFQFENTKPIFTSDVFLINFVKTKDAKFLYEES